MSDEISSLQKAVEAEAGEAIGFQFFADPAQMDLLREANGSMPADALRIERERRGPGRRPGSQNKASKDFAKYFVGKYGDPAAVFGEIMNMPVDQLYEQMKLAQGGESKSKRITGADAMRLKLHAAETILPYVHGKQPIKVDLTRRADVILNIPGLTDAAALAEMTGQVELGAEELERVEYVPALPSRDGGEVVDAEVIGDE